MARKPFRADRFRIVRDAIMAEAHRMRPHTAINFPGFWELRCGPFLIVYGEQGASGFHRGKLRGRNLQIWPSGQVDSWGHMLHNDKVANVDWDCRDTVDILTFKSGPWEAELLRLLEQSDNVRYLTLL